MSNANEQRDEMAQAHEHLWLSNLRKHPGGEVRLIPADGKPISGTYAYQVTRSIDAMVRDATRKPRTITTMDELDALAEGSVVLDRNGLSLHKQNILGTWNASNCTWDVQREELEREAFPAIVLHEPTKEPAK